MKQPDREVVESLRSATYVRPVSAADLVALTESGLSNVPTSRTPHWLTREASRARSGQVGLGPAGSEAHGHGTGNAAASVLEQLLASRTSMVKPGSAPASVVLKCLQLLATPRHIDVDDAGRVWQSRAQPSAGGTHSLEPLLHVQRVDGLGAGWYSQTGHLVGDVTELPVPGAQELVAAVSDAIKGDDGAPAATIFAICDPQLLAGRYPNGSSLLWRDAGAFLMTVHLLAHAHGLSSNLAGICVEIGTDDENVFAVGAVAIGGPAGAT